MRKIKILLMELLLPLSVFEMSADEKEPVIKIPLKSNVRPRLERTLEFYSIEAYYYGALGGIQSVVRENLGEVCLSVTNSSTGESWTVSFNVVCGDQSFTPISGSPGYYIIEYITESGDIYEGSFILE